MLADTASMALDKSVAPVAFLRCDLTRRGARPTRDSRLGSGVMVRLGMSGDDPELKPTDGFLEGD